LFADAIRFHLDRGETATAFSYAERSRGGHSTISELQRRLAGSVTAVIEIVALPAEVVTFAVSHNDIEVARRPRPWTEIQALAYRSVTGDDTASAALFDDLVRPVDRVVARASSIVFVPDPRLAGVPFAALLDTVTKQHLIEKIPLAIAFSATSLSGEGPNKEARSLAAITLPSGMASGSAELPDAEKEMGEVAAIYPRSLSVSAERATWAAFRSAAAFADVIHIGGHTEQQPGDGEQALLFMGAGGGVERISWKTIIAAPPLRARVIVLAACETLRVPASSQSRALSLGAAFSRGGADVVGTLIPIPDRDARALFRSVHEKLAAGSSAALALRAAQLEAIHNETQGRGTRAWRAVAVLTLHIPR
jgi:CHAT domain-containing protein